MHQNCSAVGLCPDPLGERSPKTLLNFDGREEMDGREKAKGGKGRGKETEKGKKE